MRLRMSEINAPLSFSLRSLPSYFLAQQIAAEYMKLADDGRDTNGPVYVINAGYEPLAYTVYFQGWDSERQANDAYFRRLTELKLDTAVVGGYTPPKPNSPSVATGSTSESTSVTEEPVASEAVSGEGFPHNPDGLIVDYDLLRVPCLCSPFSMSHDPRPSLLPTVWMESIWRRS